MPLFIIICVSFGVCTASESAGVAVLYSMPVSYTHLDVYKRQVVNSVGAGDSMVAGFVAGWMQTRSYSFALRLGTACGSATAFSLGLATKEKIDELMKEI